MKILICKMKLSIIVVSALYLCLNRGSEAAPYEAASNLTGVVIMFRHGDNTAKFSYPNDPYYNKSYVLEGFGVFLNKGKLRHLHLGQWFRQRYGSYIAETYQEDDIAVYSADLNICLQSVQSNIAGLYKLKTQDQWSPGLPWDAVPIHTNSYDNDYMFGMDGVCSKYDDLYDEIVNSKTFSDLLTENAEMIKFLSENTGWDIKDLDFVQDLYTLFSIYRSYNSSYIPSWFGQVNFTKFTELAGIAYARETYTTELRRLKTGQFFFNLLLYFSQRIGQYNSPSKITMISTTTSALTAVLNTMDVFDNVPPDFAATVIWELAKNAKGEDLVSIYYKRNDTAELTPLKLDGCSTVACDYKTVVNILSVYSLDPQTHDNECEN